MARRRAMTTEAARNVRAQGHNDALLFAKAIGVEREYQNNPIAKKDVIDHNKDTHSVKSGQKRWQIFLYGKNRFYNDYAFQSMNGIGQLLIECLEIFPEKYEDYCLNKPYYKNLLQAPMQKLCELFQEKRRVKTFIEKSFFDGGQVDYLTVYHEGLFHVFRSKDIVNVLGENFLIKNSEARRAGQFSNQKVLFTYNNINVCELEVRNSGSNHYREMLFVCYKKRILEILFEKIPFVEKFNELVLLYGDAPKLFNKKR